MRERLALARDRLEIRLAGIGAAVGEQDHAVHVLAGELPGQFVGPRAPAAVEVGRAAAADAGERRRKRQLVRRRRERREALDLVVEGEDRRAVARRQAVDDVARAALGLLERGAAHRTRAVEHQREMQRRARRRPGREIGRLHAGQHPQRGRVAGDECGLLRGEQQLEGGWRVVGVGHDRLRETARTLRVVDP